MSYFCVKTLSIDKNAETYKMRGGDNNVIPRMDYWLDPQPLALLLPDLASGCSQLMARTDKNIAIMALVHKYDKAIEEAFDGLGAYELWSHIRGTFDADKVAESKAYYADGKFSGTYAQEQIALIDKKLSIWQSDESMSKLLELTEGFVSDLVNLKIDTTKYIIQREFDGVYVKRANRYSLTLTRYAESAAKMTKLKAESIIRNYQSNYQIVKVQ
jgi:hypothetical protein